MICFYKSEKETVVDYFIHMSMDERDRYIRRQKKILKYDLEDPNYRFIDDLADYFRDNPKKYHPYD